MTTAEMLTVLGHRLEDPAGDLFSTTEKLLFLNIAQDKLVQFLNPHLMTDLQVIDSEVSLVSDPNVPVDFKWFLNPVKITATMITGDDNIGFSTAGPTGYDTIIDIATPGRFLSSGYESGMTIKVTQSTLNNGTYTISDFYPVSETAIRLILSDVVVTDTPPLSGQDTIQQVGLTYAPFGGPLGILGIRQTSSNFIRKVSWDMVKDSVTGYTSFTSTEPVYFVFKNRLYIYNHTGSVDVYYMRQPTAMEEEVDSDLNSIFHDALVEMAEAELWRTVNDETRMATAQTRGMAMISQHNSHSVTGVIGEGIPFDYSSSNSLVDPIYPPYPSSG